MTKTGSVMAGGLISDRRSQQAFCFALSKNVRAFDGKPSSPVEALVSRALARRAVEKGYCSDCAHAGMCWGHQTRDQNLERLERRVGYDRAGYRQKLRNSVRKYLLNDSFGEEACQVALRLQRTGGRLVVCHS